MSTKALSSSQSPIIQGELFTSRDHKKRLQIRGLESKTFAVAVKVLNSGDSTEKVKLKWHQRVIVWLRSIWWTEATVQDKSGQFHKVLINTNSLAKRLNLQSSENLADIDPLNLERKDILIKHGYPLKEIHEIENGIQEILAQKEQSSQPDIYRLRHYPHSIAYYKGTFYLVNRRGILNLTTGTDQLLLSKNAKLVFQAVKERSPQLSHQRLLQVAIDIDKKDNSQVTDPNAFKIVTSYYEKKPESQGGYIYSGTIARKGKDLYLFADYLIGYSSRQILPIQNLTGADEPENKLYLLKNSHEKVAPETNQILLENQSHSVISLKADNKGNYQTYTVTEIPVTTDILKLVKESK